MAITISADDGDDERSELRKLPISEFERILRDPLDPRHEAAQELNSEIGARMRKSLDLFNAAWAVSLKKNLDSAIASQLGHIDFSQGLRTIDVSSLFPDAGVDAFVTDVRIEDDGQEVALVSAVPAGQPTGEVFDRIAEGMERVAEQTQARLEQAAEHATIQHNDAEAAGAVAENALVIGKSALRVGKVAMWTGIAAAVFGLAAAVAAVWTLVVTLA